MAELAEKMEWRIHNLEDVLQLMNNEVKADWSKTSRLELNDDDIWVHMNHM